MTVKQSDILVIGGGIAGLTCAILLAEQGIKIALVDPGNPAKFPEPKLSGRTVALMEGSLNVIKATGVWEEIAHHCNPLQTMKIIDDSAYKQKTIKAPFSASEIGMEQYGHNVPNSFLHAALWKKALATKNLTLFAPGKLKDFDAGSGSVMAQLEDGTEIEARLIIGADGRNSVTRELAGISASKHMYGQNAITCVVDHTKPHNNTAIEFHRPGGPLAFVPLPDQQCSVVWVNKAEQAEQIIALKKQDFIARLQEASNGVLGQLSLSVNPECWPLCSIKASKLIAPRVALIAEAAHVMSPITAQGLNLSLRDVASICEVIVDAMRIGMDPGQNNILRLYEKRRRLDIASRVQGVDAMNRIVSQEVEWVKNMRRAAMKAVHTIPPLKRFAMNHGLAPKIDSGRLISGGKL